MVLARRRGASSAGFELLAAILAVLLVSLATSGAVAPQAAAAAVGPKVAIVVGPAGWKTPGNRAWADAAANEALRYTPNVVKVYSPNATWERVRVALTGASVVIYLGSGYGSPAPSSPIVRSSVQDGFGLNAIAGRDNTYTKWYGEAMVRTVPLAPKAVVLLAKLSYASGASEPGLAPPSLRIARQRVDNYGSGFLAAGASVVIADAFYQPAYYVRALFTIDAPLDAIWRHAPSYHGNPTSFVSTRTVGAVGSTDPDRPGSGFYRSIVGWSSTTTTAVLGLPVIPSAKPDGSPAPNPAAVLAPPQGGCGPSLQARIDAAAAGSSLDLSGCSYSAGATVGKSMSIRGAEIHPAPGAAGLTVQADGVTLDHLTIVGAQAASYAGGEYGILVAGSAAHPVRSLTVSNSDIGTFGNGGIWLQYVMGPIIRNNVVHDAVYAGIMIISGTTGRISANTVRRIGVNASQGHDGNAYGIALTDIGGAPTSSFAVTGNTVTDVPTWHALDTHGGQQITFADNTVSRAPRGLFITTSASGRPDSIVATGNLFTSPSHDSGTVQAVTTYDSSNVTITGNTASGWGAGGFFGDYLGQSSGLHISNNFVTP